MRGDEDSLNDCGNEIKRTLKNISGKYILSWFYYLIYSPQKDNVEHFVTLHKQFQGLKEKINCWRFFMELINS